MSFLFFFFCVDHFDWAICRYPSAGIMLSAVVAIRQTRENIKHSAMKPQQPLTTVLVVIVWIVSSSTSRKFLYRSNLIISSEKRQQQQQRERQHFLLRIQFCCSFDEMISTFKINDEKRDFTASNMTDMPLLGFFSFIMISVYFSRARVMAQ